ncbi:uncharacterized protein LOC34620198 [Cyclospora cayetanensis]|uniref:Uncharacterized protein LOC34620198 n=1 Tax=Cyclospora cayetanensis TaxID=88456 RepID=A0A6P6RY09_9EIME|nr:uncharacterized protein LOC34620198 [Cyclospora cayetanensis]
MSFLEQGSHEGPPTSWRRPAVVLKGRAESPARLSSEASEAATVATAATASTGNTAAAAAAAVAMAKQRQHLQQEKEFLQKKQMQLREQHEQLERDRMFQSQQKAFLEKELEISDISDPLGLPAEGGLQKPQRSKRQEANNFAGLPVSNYIEPSSPTPNGPAHHQPVRLPRTSTGNANVCAEQGHQCEQVKHQSDDELVEKRTGSKSLKQLLGPLLYAAYKRLQNKNIMESSSIPPEVHCLSLQEDRVKSDVVLVSVSARESCSVRQSPDSDATAGATAAPIQRAPTAEQQFHPGTVSRGSNTGSGRPESFPSASLCSTEKTNSLESSDSAALVYNQCGTEEKEAPSHSPQAPCRPLGCGTVGFSQTALPVESFEGRDSDERSLSEGIPTDAGARKTSEQVPCRDSSFDWTESLNVGDPKEIKAVLLPSLGRRSTVLDWGQSTDHQGTAEDGVSAGWLDPHDSQHGLVSNIYELQALLATAEQQLLKQQHRPSVTASDREVPPLRLTKHEMEADTSEQMQRRLRMLENEREYLKEALKRKHFTEMELRTRLSSVSALNEQLQAEAATLMSFHRLAEAHGQAAAEKLLLQQLRAQAEGQTSRVKELQRLLSSREVQVSALTVRIQLPRITGARNNVIRDTRASHECQLDLSVLWFRSVAFPSDSRGASAQPAVVVFLWGFRDKDRKPLAPEAFGIVQESTEALNSPSEAYSSRQTSAQARLQRSGLLSDSLQSFRAVPGTANSVMRFTVCPSQGYEPQGDDSVDTAVAALSNARVNKVLFTRLCKGVYLYGHLAVLMRLSPSGELQVSFEGKDYTAAEFIRSFEEEEFQYLTTKQEESGRALSLEVCPNSALPVGFSRDHSQGLVHKQHKQRLTKQAPQSPIKSEGRRSFSEGRKNTSRRGSTAPATRTPKGSMGRTGSRSGIQEAATCRLVSLRIAPRSPSLSTPNAAAQYSSESLSGHDRRASRLALPVPSDPRKVGRVSQTKATVFKAAEGATPVAAASAKSCSLKATGTSLANKTASPSGSLRGTAQRHRLRSSCGSAQQTAHPRKESAAIRQVAGSGKAASRRGGVAGGLDCRCGNIVPSIQSMASVAVTR